MDLLQQIKQPPCRLIVVDDIPDNLALLKAALEIHGFEICAVTTARELLQNLLTGGHWDAILLDVNLPDESGTDAALTIKKMYPRTPIAFLTAYSYSPTLKRIAERLKIPVWDKVDMADIVKLVSAIGVLARAA